MELSVLSPVPEHTQTQFAVPVEGGKDNDLAMVVVEELKEGSSSSSIVVERQEELVSPIGGKPTVRIGRFLKPRVDNVNEAAGIPLVPLLSEIITFRPCKWPPKVVFKGWRCPQTKWKIWVDRLLPLYGSMWVNAGIYNAIMASTYRVRKDQDLVLALVEKWCPQTSSFVFPWGEATITLEDTFILGGFSFVGKPITEPVTKEQEKMEKKMVEEHDGFYKHQWWNPSNSEWITHFMKTQIELEHVAFLSLWLLRYVFPTPSERSVGSHVFPIAIHLAQGTPIALGPAVLASLYRDLRFLKEQCFHNLLGSNKDGHEDDFHPSVWGPFQLLQLWAWERFPSLRPQKPNSLRPGEPRAALWSKLTTNMSIELVRLVMSSPENYQWRPYAANLTNWCSPPFYMEREEWVSQGPNGDVQLESFAHCFLASELVGIDGKEHYLPHRVAMQFGLDQDIPGHFGLTRGNCSEPLKFAMFFIPSRHFKSDVTTRYSEWWKQSMLIRREGIKDALTQAQIQVNPRKITKRSMKDKARGKNGWALTLVSSENHKRSFQDFSDENQTQKLKNLKLAKRSMKEKARGNNDWALTLVSSENHKPSSQDSTDENESQELKNLQLAKVKEEDPFGPVPPGFSSKCRKLNLEDSSHKDEHPVLQKKFINLEDSSQKDEHSVVQKFKLLKDLNESAIGSIPASITSTTATNRDLGGSEEAHEDLMEKNTIEVKGSHKPKEMKTNELEARVWELEREISGLKEKLRSKEAGESSNQSPSQSG
ncbi:uncharacterized protein LOC122080968 [Macadamia integrifolia]|uniref:uncharacterized protein LOC122080968 n=1 Tax=Macadamia integrifolia TaxID=60698 RepID=UPI001C4F8B53|nr:uncharacterized protein LOC122080968 [Macadamia integrifolia]